MIDSGIGRRLVRRNAKVAIVRNKMLPDGGL